MKQYLKIILMFGLYIFLAIENSSAELSLVRGDMRIPAYICNTTGHSQSETGFPWSDGIPIYILEKKGEYYKINFSVQDIPGATKEMVDTYGFYITKWIKKRFVCE